MLLFLCELNVGSCLLRFAFVVCCVLTCVVLFVVRCVLCAVCCVLFADWPLAVGVWCVVCCLFVVFVWLVT